VRDAECDTLFVALALILPLVSGCQFTVRIGPLEEEKVIEESDNKSWADKIRPLDPRCRTEPCERIGDIAVAMVVGALLMAGKIVLRPVSDGLRYDLVIDEGGGRFVRVQCKNGRFRNGALTFKTHSIAGAGKPRRGYGGDADMFGVFCPEIGKSFLIPVGDVGHTEGKFRIDPARNAQARGIRFAKDYEILRR
jgi:hypothetical protein